MAVALLIEHVEDLDVKALLSIIDGRRFTLSESLLQRVAGRRREVVDRLRTSGPVYGVNTGMGAASELRLDENAQSAQQDTLMLARAVGSAPWLDKRETRAAIVVRLRTFLVGDAGVSPELCQRLVSLLNLDLHPAVPQTRIGAAGEIIPLAHLGGCLTGSGEFVDGQSTSPAIAVLGSAGLDPFHFGPKEGVALIEGVPVTTALAILRAQEARGLVEQAIVIIAAELALVGANRDPFAAAVARGDDELGQVLEAVRRLAGPEPRPRALQSPLSFRVVSPAVAHLIRSIDAVDQAVMRALGGVTDSPAFLGGDFVGTAGFDGFDLAAALDGLRLSVIHMADTSAARLHRLMDDRFTGLPRQLSDRPGLHAGLVAVHKRAVGVMHTLVANARPSSIGSIETSLGQEDVQSFSVEAAFSCAVSIEGARDVLACELLGVIQGMRLAEHASSSIARELETLLAQISRGLPAGTADRPFGRDVAVIAAMLSKGWAQGVLLVPRSSREG